MIYQRTEKQAILMRIAADIILSICLFLAPFWLTALLAVLSSFMFTRYYEIIILGIMIDAVYAPSFSGSLPAPITISAVVAYIIIEFLKPRLRA